MSRSLSRLSKKARFAHAPSAALFATALICTYKHKGNVSSGCVGKLREWHLSIVPLVREFSQAVVSPRVASAH